MSEHESTKRWYIFFAVLLVLSGVITVADYIW